MKYVYASRTGNVESLVNALGLTALKIEDGSETVNEDFILFTYTDGTGDVPAEVEEFLSKNGSHIKGVVASGSVAHGDDFGLAGDKVAKQYKVPLLYKVDGAGTEEDVAAIKKVI